MFTIPVRGDRTRLVVFDVQHPDGPATRISRRYDWTGPSPEHMCVPDTCETCRDSVTRTVARRLGGGIGKTTAAMASITVLRDGQSTF